MHSGEEMLGGWAAACRPHRYLIRGKTMSCVFHAGCHALNRLVVKRHNAAHCGLIAPVLRATCQTYPAPFHPTHPSPHRW